MPRSETRQEFRSIIYCLVAKLVKSFGGCCLVAQLVKSFGRLVDASASLDDFRYEPNVIGSAFIAVSLVYFFCFIRKFEYSSTVIMPSLFTSAASGRMIINCHSS